jgi:UDP-glucose-4-epimerase GalE
MPKRAILVTGGAGYIGSHTCKALARAGHLAVVLDNLIHGHKAAVRWGPLVEGDIRDRGLVERAIREHRIDAVVHFAGHAYVGESMRDPGKYFGNNAAGSLTLLEAVQACGIGRIVFSSTCATYGVPESLPIHDEHAQRPINPYGESKLFVERALRWYGVAHGLRSVALRYFNAAGADPDGEIGEEHDPETHLIPLAIGAALGTRAPLQIYGTDYPTPDGTAVRDYVHVTDLADAHVRALDYLDGGGESTAVNLGTGRGHSVREIVAAVERVAERELPRRETARRPGDPASLVAAPGRSRELLGWAPQRSELGAIIATAWRWHTR